jgi:hypothetical protein
MGQLDSTAVQPHLGLQPTQQERPQHRVVAVQVAFEKAKGLKPGYHVSGSRLGSPGAFKLWVIHWTQLVQPHLVQLLHHLHVLPSQAVAVQVVF